MGIVRKGSQVMFDPKVILAVAVGALLVDMFVAPMFTEQTRTALPESEVGREVTGPAAPEPIILAGEGW